MDATRHPKVFISFAHESEAHFARVRALENGLRAAGIDAVSDLVELFPEEGWVEWMERRFEEADFVLPVCTEAYRRRAEGKEAPGKGDGVTWEIRLMRRELYRAGGQNARFVPVVFDAADRVHVPKLLDGSTVFTLGGFTLADAGFEALYRVLTGQRPERAALGDLVVLEAVAPAESPATRAARPWNVPAPTPYFTGRTEVLDHLRARLEEEGRAALSGFGGLGKTQCAIAYARRYRGDYSAVLWARAESVGSLVSDFRVVAQRLKLDEAEGPEAALVPAVLDWLQANSGWLLVLDNADQPQSVKGFLPPEAPGHILLTSRAQAFDALGITHPLDLPELAPEEAQRFLLARTGRSGGDPAEAAAAAELAEALGCLPLALEQAGAYILDRKSSFQDYLASYHKRRLALLEKQSVVAGDYTGSVRTTWALNFREVEEASDAAADLLRFSAFLAPDDIPLELLAAGAPHLGPAVAGALAGAAEDPLVVHDELAWLTRYSLVHRDVEVRTYSIHRLVQAVVRAELDAEAQRLWAERTVEAVNAAFLPPYYEVWDQCERLIAHARACEGVMEEFGVNSGPARSLLYHAGMYLRERGQPAEAVRLIGRALALGKEGPKHLPMAVSLVGSASSYRDLGAYLPAEKALLDAWAIVQSVADEEPKLVVHVLNNLGDIHRLKGEFDRAEPLLKRALALCTEKLGDKPALAARSLHDLGLLYFDQGWHAGAEPLLERAVEIRKEVLQPGDPEIARALDSLARLRAAQGRHAEAEALFVRALAIAGPALGPHHPRLAQMLENYAALLRAAGRPDDAAAAEARAVAARGGAGR
ncbi:MAG TPA: FxSxx-COOH system tetratricopeptide repeat protein [Longimicrobiaceae bacterium]|nr:FxSxx-COOH system tetratricopeptide repeat protein [Longimicrobiaceae bacterium]